MRPKLALDGVSVRIRRVIAGTKNTPATNHEQALCDQRQAYMSRKRQLQALQHADSQVAAVHVE
jgi:hypothetical protein